MAGLLLKSANRQNENVHFLVLSEMQLTNNRKFLSNCIV